MNKLFKRCCLGWGLFAGLQLFAQNPTISTDLPQVVPPSPTVSGLMKFEEVPVNNYTGIPDISIPIYGVQSRSGDVGINLSLNYHPGSIAAEEMSSFVGLGWSLFTGGTISRTVRGLPDDIHDEASGGQPRRYGIYWGLNHYYDIINTTLYADVINMYDENVRQYMWEAQEKGWHDTEHDLYQYNFMGYSGRFIIEKSAGNYFVKKLDNNNTIKIVYNDSSNTFTLYDEKGNKYTFDIKETTTCHTDSTVDYFGAAGGILTLNPPTNYEYISAFQLSSVKNTDGAALASFVYNDSSEEMVEKRIDKSSTYNSWAFQQSYTFYLQSFAWGCASGNHWGSMPPKTILTTQITTTSTKKVKRVDIPNKAKIYLDYEHANLGTDNSGSNRLKDIKVYKWYETAVPYKNFTFEYGYSYVDEEPSGRTRMLLTKVTESDSAFANAQSYDLSYFTQPEVSTLSIGRDYWGYFNNKPEYTTTNNYRQTTPGFCRIDALQRMTLPTGGAIDFNFEANTYSYDGDLALDNFDNEDNWTPLSAQVPWPVCPDVSTPGIHMFTIHDEQEVTFNCSVGNDPGDWQFTISTSPTGPGTTVLDFGCLNQGPCTSTVTLSPGTYYADFNTFNANAPGSTLNAVLSVNYRKRKPSTTQNQFIYGGGVRIGNISYFENVTDTIPVRQKNYNYNFTDNKRRSSGSLAFPKPVRNYSMSLWNTIMRDDKGVDCALIRSDFQYHDLYNVYTTFNNLKTVRTQGVDVGYKNVTVSETGNGRSEFSYTSPIDYPEVNPENTPLILAYPFMPAPNRDYMRGILKNEKHYDEYSKILSETLYEHDIVKDSLASGFRTYSVNGCVYAGIDVSYSDYKSRILGCEGKSQDGEYNSNVWQCYHCGEVSEYISYFQILEAFGWVKLKDKTTRDYFYKRDNTPYFVETKEHFTYNPDNKKIATYEKEVYKVGSSADKERQEYSYLSNTAVIAQNRISELERVKTYENSEQVAQQEVAFDSNYRPNIIKTGKGTGTTEARVVISKYDSYGNPLEVSKKDGMVICYIRDTATAQPLAMIQNATYQEVTNMIATFGPPQINDGTNTVFMGYLNNLRTALPKAMVTTYTYKALVGVTSVTDPRGLVTTYSYDSMGRLIEVRDHKGKLLSQNEYKYRTQQ